MVGFLQQLARAALTAVVDRVAPAIAERVVELIRGEPDAPTPMTHAAIEHNRAQERSAIAAAKADAAAKRAAPTVRPPARAAKLAAAEGGHHGEGQGPAAAAEGSAGRDEGGRAGTDEGHRTED